LVNEGIEKDFASNQPRRAASSACGVSMFEKGAMASTETSAPPRRVWRSDGGTDIAVERQSTRQKSAATTAPDCRACHR